MSAQASQLQQAIINAHNAGDTKAAERLGQLYQEAQQKEAQDAQPIEYSNPRNERAAKAVKAKESDRDNFINFAKTQYGPETVNSWENNPIAFGDVGNFLEWSQVLPGGGLVQGAKALKLLDISNNIREGKEVQPNEQEMLDGYLRKMIEMEIRGMSFGGKFRYYGEQMPAFMAEFAATGGIGKTAQTAATKAVVEAGKRQALATAAGVTARVATQTSAMVPTTVKNYGDIRVSGIDITDKGQLIVSESKENPAISALKAWAYTGADVASELSGLGAAKLINKTGLKTKAINGINKLPVAVQEGLFKAYQVVKPNAKVSEIMTRAGWNGMLLELGEERVADVLRATTDFALTEGYTFNDVLENITPDGEQLLLEAALISLPGSVKVSADIGINLLIKKGYGKQEAAEIMGKLSANEQQEFVESELKLDTSDVQDVDAGEAYEQVTMPDRPSVATELLKKYDEWQEGAINTLIELKDKALEAAEKEVRKKTRSSKKMGKIIAEQGGINIASFAQETGTDPADMRAVNKALGATVFRVQGGIPFDLIGREVESGRWVRPQEVDGQLVEAEVTDVLNEISELVANPKRLDSSVDEVELAALKEKELELINTEADALADYFKQQQQAELEQYAEENNVDVSEGESVTDALLGQGLLDDPLSEKEFEAINQELNDYISTEYQPQPTPMSTAQQTQQDAAKEEEVVAPKDSIFKDWYYTFFDELGALIDLGKAASKKGYQNNLHRLVRLYAGVTGMSTQAINNNTFVMDSDGKLQNTGVGLKSILDDFDAVIIEKEPNKAQRKADLNDYLISRRYYQDLEKREDVSVTDKQLEDSIATLDALHQKYGESLRWFDNTAQEIYSYQKRILDYMVSSGIMSKETQDTILNANQNYIPFQRVLDAEFGDLGGMVSGRKIFSDARMSKVIKKIAGSEKEIKDPIQSIMKNVFRVMDLSWQNKVSLEIAKMAEFMPEYVEKIPTPMDSFIVDGKRVFRPSKITPKDAIVVYRDGKKEFYKAHPSIIKSVERMRPEQLTGLAWLLSTPSSVLRTGATIVPEFWARNFLRDVHGTFIYSQSHATPIDAVKGLLARVGKTDLYNEWMASGGSFNSHMDMSDSGIARAQKELISGEGKLSRYLKNPLNLPMDISVVFEQAVRIGVYSASKKKGMSDADSALEARDASIDFARGGSASKALNRYIPFFNAGMQGMDKFFRAMKHNPKATIMYATASITIPSLLITGYYLNFAPEDERKEYLEIPQWQKDIFWVFKVGDTWVRYPKPFTIGYIFGSVPERMMHWAHSQGKKDGAEITLELAKGITGSLSPIYDPSAVIPPLVKVMIEDVTNHNFFRGHNIYPEYLDSLPPEMRETKYTSETAKLIGKQLNYSPAKIDNAIRGTLATSGQYVMDAGDYIINEVRKYNGETIPEKPSSASDVPLLRAFTMRFPTGGQAQSVQDFYLLSQDAKIAEGGYKKLKGKDKISYKAANRAMLMSAPYIKSKAKQIRNLNKRRNRVYENLVMTSAAKERALRKLDDQILRHARQANDRFLSRLKELER